MTILMQCAGKIRQYLFIFIDMFDDIKSANYIKSLCIAHGARVQLFKACAGHASTCMHQAFFEKLGAGECRFGKFLVNPFQHKAGTATNLQEIPDFADARFQHPNDHAVTGAKPPVACLCLGKRLKGGFGERGAIWGHQSGSLF
ncbi:hypothetical protein D3C81_647140 [compost metagenome]